MTTSATTQATRLGGPDGVLDPADVSAFIRNQLGDHDLDGRGVCILVPDATRSCPLPLLLGAVHAALAGRASRMTTLVALGTHAPMSEEALARHLGYAAGDLAATYPGMTALNHDWSDPATFVDLGTIPGSRIAELSEGRLHEPVRVLLNKAVVEHDIALVVGPVLPHEVVGISGGNKYFFPGVAGQEIIDLSHWLGALITSAEIIGTTAVTPVRALIDEAAALIPAERLAFSVVGATGSPDLHSISFGDTISSWASAAKVCAATHVTHLDAPVRRVLSIVPAMYDDIWTGAKGFYKVEPVVADGGQVILYAPHITELSAMHPEIEQIGYHCRDYFVKQWDRFEHHHWGVLANLDAAARSRHLRRRDRGGAAARRRHPGDRHTRARMPRSGSRLPRPRHGRRRGLPGRPGHPRRAAGWRGTIPAALNRS